MWATTFRYANEKTWKKYSDDDRTNAYTIHESRPMFESESR
jgi:hypothetical protein